MPIIQLKGNSEKVTNKNITILLIMTRLASHISERSNSINSLVLISYCNTFSSIGVFFSCFTSNSGVTSQNVRNRTALNVWQLLRSLSLHPYSQSFQLMGVLLYSINPYHYATDLASFNFFFFLAQSVT